MEGGGSLASSLLDRKDYYFVHSFIIPFCSISFIHSNANSPFYHISRNFPHEQREERGAEIGEDGRG
jgi:hypothetical protein